MVATHLTAIIMMAPVYILSSPVPSCDTVCQYREWARSHNITRDVTQGSLDNFEASLARLGQRDSAGMSGHGLTRFAATSIEEFAALNAYKPLPQYNTTLPVLAATLAAASLPAAMDWRNTGNVLTPVKNQHTCGGCWAFAAVEGAEAAWAIAGHSLTELSVQQVLDCDTKGTVVHGSGVMMCNNKGCHGGNTICAGSYIEQGLEAATEYPFTATTSDSSACASDPSKVVATGISSSQVGQTEEAIMSALATTGPVSISVDASTWQDYKTGVLTGCSFVAVNHAVQIVGYGTDLTAGEYWIIRNSWGSTWGEAGYIKIPRGVNCHGLLTEAGTVFSAPSVGPIPPSVPTAPPTGPAPSPPSVQPTEGPNSNPLGPSIVVTKCSTWSWSWSWDGQACLVGYSMAATWPLMLTALVLVLVLLRVLCCFCRCIRSRDRDVIVIRQVQPQRVLYCHPQPGVYSGAPTRSMEGRHALLQQEQY